MNKQQATARLIEIYAMDMSRAVMQMISLVKSVETRPDQLEILLFKYATAVQLIKLLLREYVAENPVAEEMLDQGLFKIALEELLAFNAIIPPSCGISGARDF